MPQVSNLSWIWSVLIFISLFISLNLLIFFNKHSFFKKSHLLLQNKMNFFFLI